MSGTTRVAIIGAGSSGLAQLKQLLDAFARPRAKNRLEVVLYESRGEVGGVWLSQADPKAFRRAVGKGRRAEQLYFYPPDRENPTPMYDGSRTNLPSDLMAYREHPFPSFSAIFPDQQAVLEYIQSYATTFNLLPQIRFHTRVNRLYHTPRPGRRWTIESSDGGSEEFDDVCVANGHYSDTWVPEIPGLGSFPGTVLHSRFYLRPEDYAGRSVLVVGSFASGSDLTRQLASLNIHKFDANGRPLTPDPGGFTKVYCSSSGVSPIVANNGPWNQYITRVPVIDHIDGGVIYFDDHEALPGVETIIFATGYNFSLPFCKRGDQPWCERPVLDGEISVEEREGGERRDVGGIKGLTQKDLDGLMLFLEGDRSIAFPVLQYGVVPFPLAEIQCRLTSLLWAGLLPSFPTHPVLPSNPSNPFSGASHPSMPSQPAAAEPTSSVPSETSTHPTCLPTPPSTPTPPPRKSLTLRQALVFGAPYHFTYEEYLMSICAEADGDAPDCWKRVEPWRKERRADLTLRTRTLGY